MSSNDLIIKNLVVFSSFSFILKLLTVVVIVYIYGVFQAKTFLSEHELRHRILQQYNVHRSKRIKESIIELMWLFFYMKNTHTAMFSPIV